MGSVRLVGTCQPSPSLTEVRDGLTSRFYLDGVDDSLVECFEKFGC
jgi:hypothetical protein